MSITPDSFTVLLFASGLLLFFSAFLSIWNRLMSRNLARRTEELRRSEARYRLLADYSSDMLSRYTLQGVYLYVSPACEKLLGYDSAALNGRTVFSLIHPADLNAIQLAHSLIREAPGTSHTVSYRVRHQQGHYLWFETTCRLVDAESTNEQAAIIANSRDITERQQVETELRESRELFSDLTEVASDWFWEMDEHLRFTTISERFYQETGHQPERLIGQERRQWSAEPDADDKWQHHQADLEARRVFRNFEYAIQDQAGKLRYVSVSGKPLFDWQGRFQGYRGVSNEITERKRIEKALQDSERFNLSVLNSLSAHIAVLDATGNIITVNDTWRRFAEQHGGTQSALESVGANYLEICQQSIGPFSQDAKACMAGLQAVLNGEKSLFDLEYLCASSTERLWFLLRVVPLLRPEGGLVVAHIDITEHKEKDQQILLLQTAVSHLNDIVIITEAEPINDPGPRILFANPAFERLTGYRTDEVVGQTPRILQGPETDRATLDRVRHALENWQPVREEVLNYTKTGEPFWLEMDIIPLVDETGWSTHWISVERDVTQRKQTEEQLRLAAKAFENTSDAITITDAQGLIVSVNNAFTQITGYSAEEVIGQNPSILQSGRHDASYYTRMWQELQDNGRWRDEIWNRHKSGRIYPEVLTINAVRDEHDTITHYVGVFTDLSRHKEDEARLAFLTHHDPLTRLPNRTLLLDRCRKMLTVAERHGHRVALIFIGLDHFKTVNDSLGHVMGDQLLQAVADRLVEALRGSDTLARLGGDEFVVLADHLPASQDAMAVIHKLASAFSEPFELNNQTLFINASMGVSVYPRDGTTAEVLLKNADTAVHRAKQEGRNTYQFFSAEMNTTAVETLNLMTQLRQAVRNEEFSIHYQPRFALESGEVTGLEALLRWQHPRMGWVPPDRFIPLAEQSGLIEIIGAWVLKTACEQTAIWRVAGLPIPRIAVNISARQFKLGSLKRLIASTLQDTGLPSNILEIEITESMAMQVPEHARTILAELKAMGISVSIDDFGTGYSSLSYLKRFPIDYLKIDRSFIDDIPHDSDDVAITQTIIAMAKSLRIKIIAEGVETDDQRHFLQEAGCEEAQGFLLAKPMSAPATKDFLKTRKF
ncbi:MAG: PAS domain S-box protein [Candidatus Competibacteraceae bacterium]|nr:PAS domain S-box protein [Candidatus Competibacteraceae bacterium]